MNTIYDSSLLLVDDNEDLCRMLTDMLCREGFRNVESAGSCAEAFLHFQMGKKEPVWFILDINLRWRRFFPDAENTHGFLIPVLFLSARDEDNDRLLGLGLGADDYMTKPFLPKELILRVTAVLKRTYFPPGRAMRQGEDGILQLGKKKVDFNAGTVSDGKESLQLTAKELAILKKLYENRGNIVTFDILCNTVWGDEYYGYENTLMVHIRRLREKIEENPSSPEWLLTVRGLGYRLAKEQGS